MGMLLYKRTRSALKVYGERYVSKLKQVLRQERLVATGRTLNSIDGEVTGKGDTLKYTVHSRDRKGVPILAVLDTGRKPGKRPPAQAIQAWMEAKGVQPRTKKRRFGRSTSSNIRKASFAIAKAIGEKGTIKRYGKGGVPKGSEILGFVSEQVEKTGINSVLEAWELDTMDYIERGIPIQRKR